VHRLLTLAATAGLLVGGAAAGGTLRPTERGPWLLATLPGMGTITWRCDARFAGLRTYRLAFDASTSKATERVTMLAGGIVQVSRVVDGPVRLLAPPTAFPRRQIRVVQATEPGTLRAIVTVDFAPRPVSPSHCFPYLPPATTARLFPR
jgi:hypothetical protein